MLSSNFHPHFSSYLVPTTAIGALESRLEKKVPKEAFDSLIKDSDPKISWWVQDAVFVQFNLERESNSSFLVHLESELTIFANCARCLEPVEHLIPIKSQIRAISGEGISLEQSLFSDYSPGDKDRCDASVSYFWKQRVDLGLILREQIFLSIPDYPVCAEGYAVNKAQCSIDFIKYSDNEENNKKPFLTLLNRK